MTESIGVSGGAQWSIVPDREVLIHTICPHIKRWSDGEGVPETPCAMCPATVQTSQGEGVQMCRLNAQRAADAVLALAAPLQDGVNQFEKTKAGVIDWKMEAERSSLVAPSLISGWISVFAKTPQRAAMG